MICLGVLNTKTNQQKEEERKIQYINSIKRMPKIQKKITKITLGVDRICLTHIR
jgi:hypothetical protein